jgi:hypothetical protein
MIYQRRLRVAAVTAVSPGNQPSLFLDSNSEMGAITEVVSEYEMLTIPVQDLSQTNDENSGLEEVSSIESALLLKIAIEHQPGINLDRLRRFLKRPTAGPGEVGSCDVLHFAGHGNTKIRIETNERREIVRSSIDTSNRVYPLNNHAMPPVSPSPDTSVCTVVPLLVTTRDRNYQYDAQLYDRRGLVKEITTLCTQQDYRPWLFVFMGCQTSEFATELLAGLPYSHAISWSTPLRQIACEAFSKNFYASLFTVFQQFSSKYPYGVPHKAVSIAFVQACDAMETENFALADPTEKPPENFSGCIVGLPVHVMGAGVDLEGWIPGYEPLFEVPQSSPAVQFSVQASQMGSVPSVDRNFSQEDLVSVYDFDEIEREMEAENVAEEEQVATAESKGVAAPASLDERAEATIMVDTNMDFSEDDDYDNDDGSSSEEFRLAHQPSTSSGPQASIPPRRASPRIDPVVHRAFYHQLVSGQPSLADDLTSRAAYYEAVKSLNSDDLAATISLSTNSSKHLVDSSSLGSSKLSIHEDVASAHSPSSQSPISEPFAFKSIATSTYSFGNDINNDDDDDINDVEMHTSTSEDGVKHKSKKSKGASAPGPAPKSREWGAQMRGGAEEPAPPTSQEQVASLSSPVPSLVRLRNGLSLDFCTSIHTPAQAASLQRSRLVQQLEALFSSNSSAYDEGIAQLVAASGATSDSIGSDYQASRPFNVDAHSFMALSMNPAYPALGSSEMLYQTRGGAAIYRPTFAILPPIISSTQGNTTRQSAASLNQIVENAELELSMSKFVISEPQLSNLITSVGSTSSDNLRQSTSSSVTTSSSSRILELQRKLNSILDAEIPPGEDEINSLLAAISLESQGNSSNVPSISSLNQPTSANLSQPLIRSPDYFVPENFPSYAVVPNESLVDFVKVLGSDIDHDQKKCASCSTRNHVSMHYCENCNAPFTMN